jgi:hypothetical protein
VVFTYDEGTDVHAAIEPPARGAASEGLRVLRSRAEGGALHLNLEGLAGRSYALGVRTPHRVGTTPGVTVTATPGGAELLVSFEGPNGDYARRVIDVPLR